MTNLGLFPQECVVESVKRGQESYIAGVDSCIKRKGVLTSYLLEEAGSTENRLWRVGFPH